ncbi:alpha/beta fold hydrolase [Aquincola sp. S2]|uniref:Alpha/beta fold hydrolase n=1 Tax=Pseudaquabacterium terrae TaxID=2732868 RepID=A0ABX2EFK6_9BURK|nr:alpha/beta fold hydrolase [Aquabacterium terrae]NRF67399.1 alpha/beta fold hydrolase [Aquabacterium terrae]
MSDPTAADLDRPAPEQVVQFFLTPRLPPPAPEFLPHPTALSIDTPSGSIALRRSGHGPRVLLLHGWEGQAADLAAFAPPLLDAGFEVITMDLPAHGASSGRQTSIPQSARALKAVGDVLGPLHAVIAHSVGSAVLGEALHHGLDAGHAVMIGAPAHYAAYARQVAAFAGLDEEGTQRMLELLREPLGVNIHEVSLPARAVHFTLPALFIHSSDDRIVAIADSLASAAAWRGARHLRVEGLGHRRILGDANVIAAALKFITAVLEEPAS